MTHHENDLIENLESNLSDKEKKEKQRVFVQQSGLDIMSSDLLQSDELTKDLLQTLKKLLLKYNNEKEIDITLMEKIANTKLNIYKIVKENLSKLLKELRGCDTIYFDSDTCLGIGIIHLLLIFFENIKYLIVDHSKDIDEKYKFFIENFFEPLGKDEHTSNMKYKIKPNSKFI